MNDGLAIDEGRVSATPAGAVQLTSGESLRSYLICTTPRTGSTLLTDALRGTGAAGNPDEFFDPYPDNENYWRTRFGVTADTEYVARVIAATRSPNGIFGAKVFWHQLPVLFYKLIVATGRDKAPLPELARSELGPTQYIWLRRENKIAQAISYYRARKTNTWRSMKAQGDAVDVVDRELAFDAEGIGQLYRGLCDADAKWDHFFRHYRIRPLMLTYEQLVKSYEPIVRGVLKFLDLPWEKATVMPPMIERQADERSKDWEKRFRLEGTYADGSSSAG